MKRSCEAGSVEHDSKRKKLTAEECVAVLQSLSDEELIAKFADVVPTLELISSGEVAIFCYLLSHFIVIFAFQIPSARHEEYIKGSCRTHSK